MFPPDSASTQYGAIDLVSSVIGHVPCRMRNLLAALSGAWSSCNNDRQRRRSPRHRALRHIEPPNALQCTESARLFGLIFESVR